MCSSSCVFRSSLFTLHFPISTLPLNSVSSEHDHCAEYDYRNRQRRIIHFADMQLLKASLFTLHFPISTLPLNSVSSEHDHCAEYDYRNRQRRIIHFADMQLLKACASLVTAIQPALHCGRKLFRAAER